MSNRVKQQAVTLPLALIHPGRNVRTELKNIDSLAHSINLVGLLQPLIVVPVSDDPKEGVEVIAGHRRLAACQKISYDPVECHVRARGSEEWRLLAQLTENIEREPMTVLERATAFRDLADHGMTAQKIGHAFNLTGGRVGQILRLLDYPNVMQQAAHHGTIGLHDVLAVPLEIAQETDPRTLAAQCRHGGRALRIWARETTERAERAGRKVKHAKSADNMIVGIDGALGEEIRKDAAKRHESIGQWVGIAARARLAE